MGFGHICSRGPGTMSRGCPEQLLGADKARRTHFPKAGEGVRGSGHQGPPHRSHSSCLLGDSHQHRVGLGGTTVTGQGVAVARPFLSTMNAVHLPHL